MTGSYDCVPLLDDFLEEHPDFSYKGAKGTIALTGYNGILGYRTDSDYKNRRDLSADQAAWLEAHPDFDWEKECEEAKKVAEAIKADGWNFASHTWGHIKVGEECSLERLQTDTERWLQEVAPLIGGTDTIIFAHGQDLAAWNEDYGASAKVQYLQSKGFDFFCNVDSTQYFVQMGDNYLRMDEEIWMDTGSGRRFTVETTNSATCLTLPRSSIRSVPQIRLCTRCRSCFQRTEKYAIKRRIPFRIRPGRIP